MTQRRRDPEPLGIVLIHGAAVVMEGRALIFLGPSGAGKTTISNLLRPFTTVIADDRLYLIPLGTEWHVADATVSGLKGPLTEEEARGLLGTPLGTMFRLIQAPKSYVLPVDAIQRCRYLCSAFYEFYWSHDHDLHTKKAVFSKMADISREIPGFDLYFGKSAEIVDEIRKVIG